MPRKRKTKSKNSPGKARKRRSPAQRREAHRNRAAEEVANARLTDPDLRRVYGADAIEYFSIGSLRPSPRNARRHSASHIEQIAASIRQFGFNDPLIVDEAGQVLAGHGRLEAARSMGLESVPCVRIDHLTPEAKRAYALADNRLAELSDWDEDLLAAELEELSALDLDFELEITGFDTVDLDRLLGPEPDPNERDGDSTDPDDDIPPLLAETTSRPWETPESPFSR